MPLLQTVAHERPRERLVAHGAAALADCELLAILLGTGSRGESATGLGARLAQAYGIRGLSRCDPRELRKVPGIGTAKACQVVAAFELARRAARERVPARIRSAKDAIRYCAPLLAHLEQEHFLVLSLDAKRGVRGHDLITRGLADSASVHPREVFRAAIRSNASAIIVAHNHPSGDPTPSAEDRETTRALAQAGDVLGIPLLDHLVIAAHGCASAK